MKAVLSIDTSTNILLPENASPNAGSRALPLPGAAASAAWKTPPGA
jgi:hypothetical protein